MKNIATISEFVDEVFSLNTLDYDKNHPLSLGIKELIIIPDNFWPDELDIFQMKSGDIYQMTDHRATRLLALRGFFYHSSIGLTVVNMAGHQQFLMLLKYFDAPLDEKVSVTEFFSSVCLDSDSGVEIDEYIDNGADFFYNSGASSSCIMYTNKNSIPLKKASLITH